MSPYTAGLSNDGYTYTKANGLTTGLKTYGFIEPSTNIRAGESYVWEAIVIGAGYTGLIAARDLVKAGESRLTTGTLQ
jgi:NADPH-dependent 2,4-dienoyl-CoA reductase/sulfur reductase-like enzyme